MTILVGPKVSQSFNCQVSLQPNFSTLFLQGVWWKRRTQYRCGVSPLSPSNVTGVSAARESGSGAWESASDGRLSYGLLHSSYAPHFSTATPCCRTNPTLWTVRITGGAHIQESFTTAFTQSSCMRHRCYSCLLRTIRSAGSSTPDRISILPRQQPLSPLSQRQRQLSHL